MNQMDQANALLTYLREDPIGFNKSRTRMLCTINDVFINIILVDRGIFPVINKYISDMDDVEQSDYLFELDCLKISGMSYSEFVSLIHGDK